MKKWNLVVDVAECINCQNCFISCKDEYVGNAIEGYSAPQPLHGHKWINIIKKERGRFPFVDTAYVPTMCNHCDNAPCIERGNGAVRKRDDGIVLIDPKKAVNRKDIVDSCPYGAIWWNEEHKVPQIWSFDAHLLDRGWREPRCVQTCPTGALTAQKVTDAEMASVVQREELEPIRPELGTKPRVFYKNLYRYNKLFVAGEVLVESEGIKDCLHNAVVKLCSKGKELSWALTDEFGEFKLDSLDSGIGDCELSVSYEKYSEQVMSISVDDDSVVLESIILKRP